jgi:hypothetical protein
MEEISRSYFFFARRVFFVAFFFARFLAMRSILLVGDDASGEPSTERCRAHDIPASIGRSRPDLAKLF